MPATQPTEAVKPLVATSQPVATSQAPALTVGEPGLAIGVSRTADANGWGRWDKLHGNRRWQGSLVV
jgi:hypothetical protein